MPRLVDERSIFSAVSLMFNLECGYVGIQQSTTNNQLVCSPVEYEIAISTVFLTIWHQSTFRTFSDNANRLR